MLTKYPFYKQHDSTDCGPTCIRMIAKYYGRSISVSGIKNLTQLSMLGISMSELASLAEKIGFRTLNCRLNIEKLAEISLPCILYWKNSHFVVLYKLNKKNAVIGDPAHGIVKIPITKLKDNWLKNNDSSYVLILEPTPFLNTHYNKEKIGLNFFVQYFIPYKRFFFQIILGMIAGSLLQLILPFLTQSIIDVGLVNKDISFVNLILLAQLVLTISRLSVDFIRNWIFLHIGNRISIAILSDYLSKIMKLPISFYESKAIGDVIQRVGDHKRIEAFISNTTINTVFTLINFIIFSIVLSLYSLKLFLIFCSFSLIYILWIFIFLKKRKEYDYLMFNNNSDNQTNLIQLISGIREIKLFNAEKLKKWEWESIKAKNVKLNIKTLTLSQIQSAGSLLINETKNIFITIIAVKSVINGEITLGMMLSVQYILGQLNAPIGQVVSFLSMYQDAKISLERLSEIHNRKNEDEDEDGNSQKVTQLPEDRTIYLKDLSFKYNNSSEEILKNINLTIPDNKVTAIVGSSGSGKTTLLKIILKLYPVSKGKIFIGDININDLESSSWRDNCTAVLQDGIIFNDTLEKNIAFGEQHIDKKRIIDCISICNLNDVVESLPNGIRTKIGNTGHGLSLGQKQRILLARAIYRNPNFLLLDEATNSLDSTNEAVIMSNLRNFFNGKTVIIAAHRLSTIRNADQIIVIDKGEIIEIGTHDELIKLNGKYTRLVQAQI